jgi:hypothetical protein
MKTAFFAIALRLVTALCAWYLIYNGFARTFEFMFMGHLLAMSVLAFFSRTCLLLGDGAQRRHCLRSFREGLLLGLHRALCALLDGRVHLRPSTTPLIDTVEVPFHAHQRAVCC